MITTSAVLLVTVALVSGAGLFLIREAARHRAVLTGVVGALLALLPWALLLFSGPDLRSQKPAPIETLLGFAQLVLSLVFVVVSLAGRVRATWPSLVLLLAATFADALVFLPELTREALGLVLTLTALGALLMSRERAETAG
ncbi:hypothetical protein [Deinococcus pimensis]|uniref:hypothetical protein n=1 Tax=Deinococcus pimensis TaxID=309888 RepID=UPI0004855F8E|nr:hypothetical protein [Deinococcus pimensis]